MVIKICTYFSFILFFRYLILDHSGVNWFKENCNYRHLALILKRKFNGTAKKRRTLLLAQLGELDHGQSAESELSKYSFYTELVLGLQEIRYRLGAATREQLQYLRKILLEEDRFMNRSESEYLGGIFQTMTVGALTWMLILSAQKFVEVEIPGFYLIAIIVWQLLGFISYLFTINYLRMRAFQPRESILLSALKLKSLKDTGLAPKQIANKLDLPALRAIKSGPWRTLSRKVLSIIEQWIRSGKAIEEELDFLITEVFNHGECVGYKFLKLQNVLKLSIILIFFVIPYFSFLFILVGSVMTKS